MVTDAIRRIASVTIFPPRAEVVVCGAGIAGLSVAWHLTRRGIRDVLVVDERPPLTLTSDKSTECYRNWWPDPVMVALTGRSIEILDELAARTGNAFALNRNGYLYLTATERGAAELERSARAISALGAGPLRVHRGDTGGPAGDPAGAQRYREPSWDRPEPTADGADLFLDAAEVRRRWPWAPGDVRAALHARRCGWLSAQQLGMLWLEEAREAGARLVEGRLVGLEVAGERVAAVTLARGGVTERVACGTFVDAAGPFVADVAALAGVDLPVFHELHRKVFFDDHLGVVPRETGLVVWADPVRIDWSDEERDGLAAELTTSSLAAELPAGVHFRPEGGPASRSAILLWNYHSDPVERRFPLPEDPLHVPVVARGVARALPGFAAYAEGGRRPYVDGGYYTKTRENRPLVGPLGPAGAWLIGALSGFGIMAAPAAGELLACHIAGGELPAWSAALRLERYRDPGYLAALRGEPAGQL